MTKAESTRIRTFVRQAAEAFLRDDPAALADALEGIKRVAKPPPPARRRNPAPDV